MNRFDALRSGAVIIVFCLFVVEAISQTGIGSFVGDTNAPAPAGPPGDKNRTTEEILKDGVLAEGGGERFNNLQSRFNQPLTEETLQSAYDYVMNPHDVNPRIDLARIRPLANFLAYVSTSYSNNAVVSAKARLLFDDMISRFLAGKGGWGRDPFAIPDVLGIYGNADLVLIPSIWNTNRWGNLGLCSYAIQAHGNAEALRRLVSIYESFKNQDPQSHHGFGTITCFNTILVVYERLRHPDGQWSDWHEFKSGAVVDRASNLWFNDHHQNWTHETVLETVMKEYPPNLTSSGAGK